MGFSWVSLRIFIFLWLKYMRNGKIMIMKKLVDKARFLYSRWDTLRVEG